ncbi:MAG: cysteine desulfurase [Nanohaloarchaea archaeon SW_4_43_9]|nr:MAG: cysteine desulfurase [Nanohaloarchaea archaeon SW_4_43_9]
MKPEKIKEDYPIFRKRENLVYLDNAATSQKPRQVLERISEFYSENNANIGRGLYNLANDANISYREARAKTADFIGANPSETVFVRNTTEAENLLAHSLDIDGEIVLSKMAHHSEQLPWRRKAEKEDLKISYLETENGKISLEDARKKIDENTSLVAVSHISNVFGAENPVEKITEIAHENDALVVLDGAQSVPHMPVDVEELGVDFLCFSGHKMLGPTGIGVLYGRKELLEKMDPYQVGGGMIRKVTEKEIEYEQVPEKFEAGTPNVAGAVGLEAAIDYLENIGMNEIYSHSQEIAASIIEKLEKVEGVNVLSPEGANLVSFTTEFAHPHDVAEVLNQNGVAVRAGHHCAQPQMEELDINGTARVSPYIYNTRKDVEKLVEAVKEVRKVFQ